TSSWERVRARGRIGTLHASRLLTPAFGRTTAESADRRWRRARFCILPEPYRDLPPGCRTPYHAPAVGARHAGCHSTRRHGTGPRIRECYGRGPDDGRAVSCPPAPWSGCDSG